MSCAMLILAGSAASPALQALVPDGSDCLANALARAALAAGGAPVLRVLGARALAVAAHPPPAGASDVFNLFWSRGAGAYVARGLQAALAATRPAPLSGVIVLPSAPAARVEGAALRRAAALLAADAAAVVTFSGRDDATAPLGFGRACFEELLALDGDETGWHIARRHRSRLLRVDAVSPSPDSRLLVPAGG